MVIDQLKFAAILSKTLDSVSFCDCNVVNENFFCVFHYNPVLWILNFIKLSKNGQHIYMA